MGRRPNQVIMQYFQRGPKLADNSNRYPQTCKKCGESFPKGRIDSLTAHLTRRCPAISEAERVNALLTLNGISSTRMQNPHNQPRQDALPVGLQLIQEGDLSALGVLAEVSRQIIDEKRDDRGQVQGSGQTQAGTEALQAPASSSAVLALDRFETQDQFMLENPPSNYTNDQPEDDRAPEKPSPGPERELSTEDQMQALVQPATTADEAQINVAAAATARLNPSLLDPALQVLDEDIARALERVPTSEPPPAPPSNPQQPWGEITYMATGTLPPVGASVDHAPGSAASNRNVFRLDQHGAKARHSRAKFDQQRRKEVQEVRKIGACIRCRILRKNCSLGTPCDTCRKVLAPRVWRSGCVRTKFTDQLDMYSAGVQIVQAQKMTTQYKSSFELINTGTLLEARLFPDVDKYITIEVIHSAGPTDQELKEKAGADTAPPLPRIVILDNEKEDVPAKLEAYMREVLPEIIRRETSRFARVTLETASHISQERNDELLKKAIELWALVDIIDRELSWHLTLKSSSEDTNATPITAATCSEAYRLVCLQLTAAAERKAWITSKSLLTSMQRVLQDSKTKIDHDMFFTTLILLNCVEKSTWAFKAWEQDPLRPNWPLEKPPSNYTQQGYVITDLLRMLLGIRRVLPKTAVRPSDGVLVVEDRDPVLQAYFEELQLKAVDVQAKQQQSCFLPTDSRSLDLHFCSTLLLPGQE